eukprot:maker-scaffold_17-snap-gene-6.69-mRNA-1 protein AED:0.00 eAED:0.00 QI:82/1/1/1/1/1/2/145/372
MALPYSRAICVSKNPNFCETDCTTFRLTMTASSKLRQITLPLMALGDIFHLFKTKNLSAIHRLLKAALFFFILDLQQKKIPKFLTKTILFSSPFIMEYLLSIFSWNLSLYTLIRVLLSSNKSSTLNFRRLILLVQSPKFIFGTHCVHNYLITNKAEWIQPDYLKVYLKTLPNYSKNVKGVSNSAYKSWLKEFSSEATASEKYQDEQLKVERLKKLPGNYLASLKIQGGLVFFLYALGTAFNLRNQVKRKQEINVFDIFHVLLSKTIRSSVVLTSLPFILTEFPVIYATLRQKKEVNRATGLHVILASICSTGVFLAEPKGRLKMLMGYTWWRILEAFIRKGILLSEEDEEKMRKKEKLMSASLIGFSAILCL